MGSELNLPLSSGGHYIIFFFVRLIFHPFPSPPPDNYCTVPLAIISFGYSSTGAKAANFCSVFVLRVREDKREFRKGDAGQM